MKILIVDDAPANLKLLRALLEAENFAVVEAADGQQALASLERDGVDAIISDILMPRMDGYRLCQEVRKDPRWKALPFIFYTATYTSPSDEKLCYDLRRRQIFCRSRPRTKRSWPPCAKSSTAPRNAPPHA